MKKELHYETYLLSEKWKETRKKILERDDNKCKRCFSTVHLHVHHKTYKGLGRERYAHLVTLCEKCHFEYHELYKKSLIETTDKFILELNSNYIADKNRKLIIHKQEGYNINIKKGLEERGIKEIPNKEIIFLDEKTKKNIFALINEGKILDAKGALTLARTQFLTKLK